MSILSTIFVVARVFTRSTIMGKTHADDWLTVVAVVSESLFFPPGTRLRATAI